MSTQFLPLQSEAWTLVYSGPTTAAIAVEPGSSMGTVWLALSATPPAVTARGHLLSTGKIKMVELSEGENLYAYAAPLTGAAAELVITD
ncbi:hypothetical protein [Enterobacter mori]|uniref:hypothetical protein n=1 Tax=Enterobacter mori TaxID=539813 RepID=UPI003B8438C2